MPANTRIQLRRGTAAAGGNQWTNQVLYAGEIGFETDTGKFKIGDGTTAWNSLGYSAVLPSEFDELVDDRVSNLLVAGSNISLTYNDEENTLTVAASGSATENIQEIIGNSVVAGSGISVSYSEESGNTTISLSDPTIELADITDLTTDARTFLSTPSSANLATLITDETGSGALVFGTAPTISNVTLSGTVTIGTDSLSEVIEDTIGTKVKAGSNITVSYNDTNGETTIAASGVSLVGHTHNLSDITDVTSSAAEVNLLTGSIANTVVNGKAVIYGSNGQIRAKSISSDSDLYITTEDRINAFVRIESSEIQIDGPVNTNSDLSVGGNLIVSGTTTTVNSTVVTVKDPVLTLGGDTAPTSSDNKDRGIEFRYFSGSAKIGFFGFDDSTGKFTFIPDATNSSEVFSGTKGELDANVDWSNVLNKPDPVITVTLTGDVTGTANATLTDLTSGTVTISTTVAADSVALGTDTTGNYVASISNGSFITGGNGGSEGAALTLAVDATSTNTASKVVARDSSGDFAAGNITATGLTNATLTNCVIDGGTP
jgi:hypothetical protein